MLEVRIHHAHVPSTRDAQPFDNRPREAVVPLDRRAMDQPDRNPGRATRYANDLARLVVRVVDENDLSIVGERSLQPADELTNVRGFVPRRDEDGQVRRWAVRSPRLRVSYLHVFLSVALQPQR
jgi:hypothetical protein